MRCVGLGFEGATSGSVSAHGRLDVLALQHRSSQGERRSEAGGRSCPRGQDPIHPRGIEGRRRVVSVSVSAEGASVFVTADSLSSREAAQQGIAVGQCKRRKRLVAMDVVFCMFSALNQAGSRVTHCSTGGCQLRPSPGQLPAEALGSGGVLSKDGQVGWLGCLFGLDGGEGQPVSPCAAAAGNALLVTGPGQENHHSPL